jgi:hypothetical protein
MYIGSVIYSIRRLPIKVLGYVNNVNPWASFQANRKLFKFTVLCL